MAVNGQWVPYGAGSTVGYRRLIKGQPVDSRYIGCPSLIPKPLQSLTDVSVYKTPTGDETDGYQQFDYHSDRTERANGQWNEEEKASEALLWTKKEASVTYQFEGTKPMWSQLSPGHEMDVYVDGQKLATVNTQAKPQTLTKRSETPVLAGSL